MNDSKFNVMSFTAKKVLDTKRESSVYNVDGMEAEEVEKVLNKLKKDLKRTKRKLKSKKSEVRVMELVKKELK